MDANATIRHGGVGDILLTTTSGGNDISIGVGANSTVSHEGNGNLKITAADDILIGGTSRATHTGNAGEITVDSDSDNNGSGGLSFGAGASLNSSGRSISITTSDVSIGAGGAINAGAGNITIQPSTAVALTIGQNGGSFDIADAELDRITSSGTTTFGDTTTTSGITVDGATPANLTGNVVFESSGTVSFSNNASTFGSNVTVTSSDIAINVVLDVGSKNATFQPVFSSSTIGIGNSICSNSI